MVSSQDKMKETTKIIISITTTIAPPSVTVNTGGQSAEEIAADHEFSTDAQNTIANAPTSTTTGDANDSGIPGWSSVVKATAGDHTSRPKSSLRKART